MSAGPRVFMCGVILVAAYCTASSLHKGPAQLATEKTQANGHQLDWQASVEHTSRNEPRFHSNSVSRNEMNNPLQAAPADAVVALPEPPVISKSKQNNGHAKPERANELLDDTRIEYHDRRLSNSNQLVPNRRSRSAKPTVQVAAYEEGTMQIVSRETSDVNENPLHREKVRYHTIRHGETLQTIANRYFGEPGRYLDIYRENQDVLDNPASAPPGTKLRMPPK